MDNNHHIPSTPSAELRNVLQGLDGYVELAPRDSARVTIPLSVVENWSRSIAGVVLYLELEHSGANDPARALAPEPPQYQLCIQLDVIERPEPATVLDSVDTGALPVIVQALRATADSLESGDIPVDSPQA